MNIESVSWTQEMNHLWINWFIGKDLIQMNDSDITTMNQNAQRAASANMLKLYL